MPDHVLIYLIVLLNAFCQLMLIWSQKRMGTTRWFFMVFAVLIPLLAAVAMRALVAYGVINGHIAKQSRTEHLITNAMSILLIAGPWIMTLAAVLFNRSKKVRHCT
jgi:hypothetical protein